jgi:RHS repeat-associated protein
VYQDDGLIKLEIEDYAIDIIGGNPKTPAINTENHDDHYSGLWQHFENTPTNGSDPIADVSLLTWIERGLEVSTLAIFDIGGDPIWFQATNCNDPTTCTPSGAGYFDGYIAGADPTQEQNLPNDSYSNSLLAIAYGFNPLGGQPSSFGFNNVIEHGGVFFYGKMGRCLNTGLATASDPQRFRNADVWYDINYSLYSQNDNIANRSVSSTLGLEHSCSSSNLQLHKTASLHDIRFFINDKDESETSCDPNTEQECLVKFQWFTDDDFPTIEPYYSTNNGLNYAKLADICSQTPPDGYVATNYLCNLTTRPGVYKFQLRKDKYGTTGQTLADTIVIAESQDMTIMACTGDCIPNIDIVPDAASQDIAPSFTHQIGAGPQAGSGGVSGGAATYNLPLPIPPGRNGMTPGVSINYSSKGGNGPLGIGWSISAGSSIYRCPQTLAQDNNNHAVDFSTNDRLCLDGQRLMLKTGNDYFVNGSTYRTEQNSFAKITKISNTKFEVKTKSGRTNTYTQQGTQQTTWQLSKEQDTFNNNIIYNYVKYGKNEWLLDNIFYTGTGNSNGNRSINFNYGDRTKAYSHKYLANEITESTKRLDKIEIYAPNNVTGVVELYRSYDLIYVPDNTENLLLLQTIEETVGSTTRTLVQTTWQGNQDYNLVKPIGGDFTINSIELTSEMIASLNGQVSTTNNLQPTSGVNSQNITEIVSLKVGADINGDGSKEVLAGIKNNQNEFEYSLLSYNTQGELLGQIKLINNASPLLPSVITNGNSNADFNGDGITDLLFNPILSQTLNNFQIAIWKGEPLTQGDIVNLDQKFRFFDTGIPKIVGSENNRNLTAVDLNNDGFPDLVYTRLIEGNNCSTTGNQCDNQVFYRKNLGINSNCAIPGAQLPCSHNPIFGPETQITIINFSGFSPSANDTIAIQDLNQDGFADILINNGRKGLVRVEFFDQEDTGGDFHFFTKNIAGLGIEDRKNDSSLEDTYYLFTDINGDGSDDFLYVADPYTVGGNTFPAEWRYQLNTGDLNTGLFAASDSTGLSGSANGLPNTIDDCNSIEYGGSSGPSTSNDKCSPRRGQGLILADVNSDGINDILLPNPDDILIDVCVEVTVIFDNNEFKFYDSSQYPDGPPEPGPFVSKVCSKPTIAINPSGAVLDHPPYTENFDFDFYDAGIFTGFDKSVYGYDAYIIQSEKEGVDVNVKMHKATLAEVPKIIYKKIGKLTTSGDLFGDGDQDYTSRVVCPYRITAGAGGGTVSCGINLIDIDKTNPTFIKYAQSFYGVSATAPITELDAAALSIADNIVIGAGETGSGEFFITRNDSTTAGLVANVSKPSQNLSVDWTYQPLSTNSSNRSDFPLYTVPDRLTADSYVDEDLLAGEHFYFNSSMYVVADMRQTNNYGGNSLNEYAYEEAVFNNQGRGFQGFRKISVRSTPDESTVLYDTISTSIFHQVFPLAGKLESIEITVNNGSVINKEIYCYDGQTYNASNNTCVTPLGIYDNDGAIVFHPLNFRHSRNFELNNGQLASDNQANFSYDAFGNILNQSNTLTSYNAETGTPVLDALRTETTVTSNTYYAHDQNNWWIDKLQQAHVQKTASDTTSTSHHSYSNFLWKSGNKRELDCQYTSLSTTLQSNCNSSNITNIDISQNAFAYDSHGNILNVKTAARDHNNAIAIREITTSYDSTGYFPLTITKLNPTGFSQTSSFEYDIATGQVTKTTQPDGNYIRSNYDAFGFKRDDSLFDRTNFNFSPVSYSNIRDCTNDCSVEQSIVDNIKNSHNQVGMITGSPQLLYQTEQRQDGQPHVITWYDSANNPVITKTYHSDNSTTNAKINYVVNISSPLGVGIISTQPFVNQADAFPSISIADVQGRVIEKITKIGDLSNNSLGNCQLQTIYDHFGGLTNITATSTGSNCSAASPVAQSLSLSRLYDATGKLLSTTDADSQTVSYQYDPSGNPFKLIDAQGNTITTTFDVLGRKQLVDDPNMGIKSFVYNGFGEVTEQIDAENHHSYYQYDAFGRISNQYSNVIKTASNTFEPINGSRSYADGYTYDTLVIGQLSNVIRASNMANNECGSNCFQQHYKKEFTYDIENRLTSEKTILTNALTPHNATPDNSGNDNANYITRFHYDGYYNRLKQVVYANSYSVENSYTQYGVLKQQFDSITGISLMEVTGWNDKGQETNRIFNENANMTSSTSYYASTGQIKQIQNHSAENGLEQLDYQYDIWGNIKSQFLNRNNNQGTEAASELFVYDRLHRLKSSNIGSNVKAYNFDNLGNITQKSDFSNSYTYGGNTNACGLSSSAGPNAVTAASLIDGNGLINYHYDARGNRVRDCINNQIRAEYLYDYNNLLVETSSSISNPATQILEFNYGADNQRYRKYDRLNSEITLYANKDYEEIYKNSILEQQKYYITSYMTITRDLLTGVKVNFMQKDRLGSTTQILDQQGFVLHTKSYDAFGKPRNGDWSDMAGGLFQAKLDFNDTNGTIDLTKRGFTDHEHLDEMQLIHMNGRMYDYNNGRFLSVDPFIQSPTSTQSLNPYTYIFNNPLSGVDPTGYACESDDSKECGEDEDEDEDDEFEGGQGFTLKDGIITIVYNGRSSDGSNSKNTNDVAGTENKQGSNKSELENKGIWASIKAWWTSDAPGPMGDLKREAPATIEDSIKEIESAFQAGDISRNTRDMLIHRTKMSVGTLSSLPSTNGDFTMLGAEIALSSVGVKIGTGKGVIPLINGRKPINSKFAGTTHPSGVPFKNTGFPDFGEFKVAQVKIGNLTGQSSDFVKANRAAGFKNTPDGFTWHHVEDGVTMQLVPTKIHNAARHTGGAAILRSKQ